MKCNPGLVKKIILTRMDHLSLELGAGLLKERELKDKYGVSIELAGGKYLGLDQGMSLN